VPVVEPVGFGYIQTGNAPVFTNLTNKRKDIALHVIDLFYRAKGVYKDRMLEAFNPLFWIMFLVNLPENLFSYLGFPTENVFSRIIQLFYWVAVTVIGLILVTYETEISYYSLLGRCSTGLQSPAMRRFAIKQDEHLKQFSLLHHILPLRLLKSSRVYQRNLGPLAREEFLNRQNLDFRILAVGGFVKTRLYSFC
jgi:hypothetical protein